MKLKAGSLKILVKLINTLTRFIKNKNKKEVKTQIRSQDTNIRNEMDGITTDDPKI